MMPFTAPAQSPLPYWPTATYSRMWPGKALLLPSGFPLYHGLHMANAASPTQLCPSSARFPGTGATVSAELLPCRVAPEGTMLLPPSLANSYSSFQIKVEGHFCLPKRQVFQPTLEPK